MRRRVAWVLGIASALAALAACLVLGLVYALHIAPFRGDTFTPERWRAVWECGGLGDHDCAMRQAACPRGGMVADLTARHLQPGQDRASVRSLLGPARSGALILPDGHHADCDHYPLGMCSGLGIDTDSLYICYDNAGRITVTGHVQH